MNTPSEETTRADSGGSSSSTVVTVVVALLVVAPIIALDVSPYKADGSLWYLGMLPVLMGLFVSRRVAFAAAGLTPVIVGISLLLKDLPPIVGALYMLVLGAATGLSARRGWHVMMSFAAPLAALALIGTMHVSLPSERVESASTLGSILATMVVLLAGGLWTALLGPFVISKVHVSAPAAIPERTSWYFAASMGGLVGIASFVALTWLPPNSWWIVLTMYVVVQPYYADAVKRVTERVIGTLVGATAAGIVVYLLHGQPAVLAGLALVLTLVAAWANLKLPYWAFVMFLTLAVVLQTSGTIRDLEWAIIDRAGYTVVGAVLAIIVLSVGHAYLGRHPHPAAPPRFAAG